MSKPIWRHTRLHGIQVLDGDWRAATQDEIAAIYELTEQQGTAVPPARVTGLGAFPDPDELTGKRFKEKRRR